jgi:hypothetical protein
MCCASRCFYPCLSGRCASLTARDFARAVARTATASHAPAMWVQATPAGRRWPDSAAGSSPDKQAPRVHLEQLRVPKPVARVLHGLKPAVNACSSGPRHERNSCYAESEKAPLNAPHRTSPLARLSDRCRGLRVPRLPREKAPPSRLPQVRRIQGTRRTRCQGRSQVVFRAYAH